MANEPNEQEEGFDSPPENTESKHNDVGSDAFDEEAEAEGESFDEPDPDGQDEDAGDDSSESYQFADFEDGLLQVHQSIEQFLARPDGGDGSSTLAEDAYEGVDNIIGVGLGVDEDDLTTGAAPGTPSLNVYVVESTSGDEVRAALTDSMGVAAAATDDVPINVIVTGPVDANSHRFKMRAAPGGVSVGHTRVTAGTLGCLARGNRAPRNRRRMILSNNHVLANSNSGRFGDSIVQPGVYDGGRSPRDRVGILERFVPIQFNGRANYVDCATSWTWPRRVRPELVYLFRGRRRLFRISNRIRGCRRGMAVGKSGRTTQLTAGRVTDCNVTIRVNFGRGRVALFRDQIAIRGSRRPFSAGGDSGSVIWTWDRRRNPVGLLFAGGGGVTFANKMWRVLRALDIRLET